MWWMLELMTKENMKFEQWPKTTLGWRCQGEKGHFVRLESGGLQLWWTKVGVGGKFEQE